MIHLINWDYDPAHDSVRTAANVKVNADLKALGLKGNVKCTLFSPGKDEVPLSADKGVIIVPELYQWAVLQLGTRE